MCLVRSVSFPLNQHISSWLYSVNIKKVTFTPVQALTQAEVAWVDGKKDTLRINIFNITANADIDVTAWLLHIIPLSGAHVDILDMNVTLDVSLSSPDNLHWAVSLAP